MKFVYRRHYEKNEKTRLGEIFVYYISHKGPVLKKHKELLKFNTKK